MQYPPPPSNIVSWTFLVYLATKAMLCHGSFRVGLEQVCAQHFLQWSLCISSACMHTYIHTHISASLGFTAMDGPELSCACMYLVDFRVIITLVNVLWHPACGEELIRCIQSFHQTEPQNIAWQSSKRFRVC